MPDGMAMRIGAWPSLAARLAACTTLPSMRAATAVLSAAGIDTLWQVCAPSPAPTDACASPLEADELAIRLAVAPGTGGTSVTRRLGFALVPADRPLAGQFATVYRDRVDWLAGRGRVSRHTVLGWAIAHEVGHLLIGSNDHTDTGLMRASWSDLDLRRNVPDDWAFDPALAGVLRAHLTSRVGASAHTAGPFGCGTD